MEEDVLQTSHKVCLTRIHLYVVCFLRGHPGGTLCKDALVSPA